MENKFEKIGFGERSCNAVACYTVAVTEPFTAGRAASRLLFDFSIMAALIKQSEIDKPILDFGAGTGWISEFCVRMGLKTVAFDICEDLRTCLGNRVKVDRRIDQKLLECEQGDGHAMPFEHGSFGNLLWHAYRIEKPLWPFR